MAGKKPRYGRKKQLSRYKKKRKIDLSPVVMDAQTQPAARSEAAAPPTKLASPEMITNVPHYPYIKTELRRIVIFAGIILVVLVLLSIIIS